MSERKVHEIIIAAPMEIRVDTARNALYLDSYVPMGERTDILRIVLASELVADLCRSCTEVKKVLAMPDEPPSGSRKLQ